MNILIVEDRISVSRYMKKALRKLGHVVFHALNIYDARECWEDENITIDCLIVDLNMTPDGLTDDEIKATKDGVLTGWIWLKNHVFDNEPNMRPRTIIYTEYKTQLEREASGELGGIRAIIPKRGSTSTAQAVLDQVRAISEITAETTG